MPDILTPPGPEASPRRLDRDAIKSAASGQWPAILSNFGEIDASLKGQPCPKCGGTDRLWLFKDFAETGGVGCNSCGKFPDGIAAIQWLTGWDFRQTLAWLNNWLNLGQSRPATGLPKPKKPAEPARKKINAPDARIRSDFSHYLKTAGQSVPELQVWADRRSVSLAALLKLGAWCDDRGNLSFPERNELGQVTGIQTRYSAPADGGRRFNLRGKRGFQFTGSPREQGEVWYGRSRLILIPEGFADVASCFSAGVQAVGRYTRDADLRGLAVLLGDAIPADVLIAVVLENDPSPAARPGVERQARRLAAELGRPVHIVSPPKKFNDLNDHWKSLVADEASKHDAVKRFASWYASRATEVPGWSDELLAANRAEAIRLQAAVAIVAELRRAERVVEGVDADYDQEPSCAFHRSFVRDLPSGGQKASLKKIACGKSSCWTCRQRLVIPRWSHRLIEVAAAEIAFFEYRFCNPTRVASEKQLRSWKKAVARGKGRWFTVAVRNDHGDADRLPGEVEVVGFATTNTGGHHAYHPLLGRGKLESFSIVLECTVATLDPRESQPVRLHRGYSVGESPADELWERQFRKVSARDGVRWGVVTGEVGAAIRRQCRSATGEARRNYIGARLENGQELIATDLPTAASGGLQETAAASIRLPEDAKWFSSGGWRPRESFYRRAGITDRSGRVIHSPSEFRDILGAASIAVPSRPAMESVVDEAAGWVTEGENRKFEVVEPAELHTRDKMKNFSNQTAKNF